MKKVSEKWDALYGAGAPHAKDFGCPEGVYCCDCSFRRDCDVADDLPAEWRDAAGLPTFAARVEQIIDTDPGCSIMAASRGNGCSSPNWVCEDTVRELIDSGELEDFDEITGSKESDEIILETVGLLDPEQLDAEGIIWRCAAKTDSNGTTSFLVIWDDKD